MSDLLFMKMDGIEGEEPVGSDQKSIRLTSFSHGLSVPVTPGRVSVGEDSALRRSSCEHAMFSVTKFFDKTSSKLFAACANCVLFESVAIYLCMSDKASGPAADGNEPAPFLSIIMENVIIANFSYSYASGWPDESLTLRYSSIGWKTKWFDPEEGSSENLAPVGWNGAENVPDQLSIPSSVEWSSGGLM